MIGKKKYKFTDRKHSRNGIISCGLGAAALLMTAGAFAAAYAKAGQAGRWIAVVGFLALILTGAGLYYGFLGLGEEDVYPVFPWLGCGLNVVLALAFVLIYVLGW